MPQIGQRAFVLGGNKKYASLVNNELIRYIGSDWLTLRVGILCAMGTDGTNNLTNTTLALGVCSGNTNPVGTNPTTAFSGMRGIIQANNFTYTANSGNPYFNMGLMYGLRRVNNTDTTAGIGNTTAYFATNTGSVQRRSLFFIDLARSGSVISFATNTGQLAQDFDFEDFLEALEYPSNPVAQNSNLFAASSQSINVGDANGPLDHVDLCWKNALNVPLEIYAWGAWRKT